MLIWFLSNHCILCLVLNVLRKEKNTEVCMAGLFVLKWSYFKWSYFDNILLNLSAHAYFFPYYQDMKILKV